MASKNKAEFSWRHPGLFVGWVDYRSVKADQHLGLLHLHGAQFGRVGIRRLALCAGGTQPLAAAKDDETRPDRYQRDCALPNFEPPLQAL